MSFLQRIGRTLRGLVPSIVKGATSALASGSLQSAAAGLFAAGKGVVTAFRNGTVTLPSNTASIPQFLRDMGGLIKQAIPAGKEALGIISRVNWATNEPSISGMSSALRSKVTTAEGTALAKSLDQARVEAESIFSSAASNAVGEMENATIERVINSADIKSAQQFDTVRTALADTAKTVRGIASGSDLAPNGIVTTGDKIPWKACFNQGFAINEAATSGFGVAPVVTELSTTYTVVTANQHAAAVGYTPVVGNYVIKKKSSTPPKTGCYNWKTMMRFRYKITSAAAISTYAGLKLAVVTGNEVTSPVHRIALGSATTEYPNKLEGDFRINVDSAAEVFADVAIEAGLPSATSLVVQLFYIGEETVGKLKTGQNTCMVTDVTYWDGVSLKHVEVGDTWLDLLGKVDRITDDPEGTCADPNLSVEPLWQGLIEGGDNAFRVMNIADQGMLKLLPALDNHNTMIYAQYGGTLTDFGNVHSWIYTDGPMAGLSLSQKRAVINHFQNHVSQTQDFLVTNTEMQAELYDKLTDATS
jgi:hypothetical protein